MHTDQRLVRGSNGTHCVLSCTLVLHFLASNLSDILQGPWMFTITAIYMVVDALAVLADIAYNKSVVQDLKTTGRWKDKGEAAWGHGRLPGNKVLFDLCRQPDSGISGHMEFLREALDESAAILKKLRRYGGGKSGPPQHLANADMHQCVINCIGNAGKNFINKQAILPVRVRSYLLVCFSIVHAQ